MTFSIFAIWNNVRSPFPMSQMHLSCPRRPLAPRMDLLIGGMFIDGNIFHSFGLSGIRADLYLGGRRVQEMAIYVGLKYGVKRRARDSAE
ncbi:hypothetical protein CEXT_467791 [Caerostris extrusa]|uniref:Uncharacterized protein n=1 Tax=Caerostris extrusa TaxID=172846 RepID=A0AAV4MRF2_CAEEX|nr:hypothetical protein CEXT_467791 [Caerostris extrusa]